MFYTVKTIRKYTLIMYIYIYNIFFFFLKKKHILGVPFFYFLREDIISHWNIWNERSDQIFVPYLDRDVPIVALYALLNVITQYICIRGVFSLMGLTNSLTCTLTLSVRKFCSLVFSVIYFNNPFTKNHIIAVCFVFVGTYFYIQAKQGKKQPDVRKETVKNEGKTGKNVKQEENKNKKQKDNIIPSNDRKDKITNETGK